MRRRDFLIVGGGIVGGGLAGTGGAAFWNWLNDPPAIERSPAAVTVAASNVVPSDGRLPAGARVLIIGDSIFAGNNFAIASDNYFALTHNASGELIWAYLADPRFRFDIWQQTWDRGIQNVLWDGYNMGIGGSRANRLADPDELAHIRTLDPDIVIVGFGANDIPLGSSANDFIARITAFCDEMIERDKRRVIVATVRPHVVSGTSNAFYDYAEGDRKWDVHFAINDFIQTQLPSRYPSQMLGVWDTFTPLADPASYRSGEFVADYTRDGVHLNDIGAFHSGMNLVPVLQSMIAPGTHFSIDPTADNLLSNGQLSGGTVRALPGIEGSIPQACQIIRSLGETATLGAAREADEEFGGEALVLTIDGVDDGVINEFTVTFHEDRYIANDGVAGRFMQLYIPVEVDAYSRFIRITGSLADDDYRRFSEGLRFLSITESNWHGRAFKGWIITPPVQLSEDAAGFRASLSIRMFGGGEGNCRVKIRPAVIARLIDDPRPAEWRT